MIKIIFAFVMSLTISYAQLIDGIALVVNDDPITLYDIEKMKNENKLSKEEAVSKLVDKALFNQLIKKHNVNVDILDINEYLEKLADSNGLDIYTFKSLIKQKYKDYDKYEKEVEELILRQKLIERLVRGKINIATEEDLKIYYDNNKTKFQMASKVSVIEFASFNRIDLKKVIKNPISNIAGVSRNTLELEQSTLNPRLRYMINETNINQFTPVFRSSKKYISFLITKKDGLQVIKFVDVKDKIFNIVMKDRENKYLKDYFEKLKLSADIRIVR
ncbi:MAG: peptidyl-prolyl cis-trans isomerase [Arcobacter sp.]|nr:peptidyl-prolyl cis-trans isomerase [Arcobacter sp.]